VCIYAVAAMDGLSALSVAASVAQFIEFGHSIVSKSNEIYNSAHGASIQNVEYLPRPPNALSS
jgi:hypothetical protein